MHYEAVGTKTVLSYRRNLPYAHNQQYGHSVLEPDFGKSSRPPRVTKSTKVKKLTRRRVRSFAPSPHSRPWRAPVCLLPVDGRWHTRHYSLTRRENTRPGIG